MRVKAQAALERHVSHVRCGEHLFGVDTVDLSLQIGHENWEFVNLVVGEHYAAFCRYVK